MTKAADKPVEIPADVPRIIPADPTPEQAAGVVAAEPEVEKNRASDRLLSVAWPVDAFEHHVDGVPVLTQTPTAVPASKAKAVLAAAEASGLTLKEF